MSAPETQPKKHCNELKAWPIRNNPPTTNMRAHSEKKTHIDACLGKYVVRDMWIGVFFGFWKTPLMSTQQQYIKPSTHDGKFTLVVVECQKRMCNEQKTHRASNSFMPNECEARRYIYVQYLCVDGVPLYYLICCAIKRLTFDVVPLCDIYVFAL